MWRLIKAIIFLIVEKSNLNLDPFWTDLIQSAPKWSGHFYTHVAISTYMTDKMLSLNFFSFIGLILQIGYWGIII